MSCFKCTIGEWTYEDELPADLPQEIYDWWYACSHVDGVRIGPKIERED